MTRAAASLTSPAPRWAAESQNPNSAVPSFPVRAIVPMRGPSWLNRIAHVGEVSSQEGTTTSSMKDSADSRV